MNPSLLFFISGIAGAYFLGSIPSSVWIGRVFFGVDVREHGSGNAGASNTLRVLGKPAGISVLAIDFLKGLAATSIAFFQYNAEPDTTAFRNIQMVFAIFAVFGHVYPIFVGFKGGKGIATLWGSTVGISWKVSVLCLIVFVLIVWITRYISLGSMIGCLASPFFVWFIYGPEEKFLIYYCILVGLLAIYTHRTNIGRLRNGTETKFGFNKKAEISRR